MQSGCFAMSALCLLKLFKRLRQQECFRHWFRWMQRSRQQKGHGRQGSLTAIVVEQSAFHHFRRSPLELQGRRNAGLRVQHDGVVGMLPAAPPELVLHILRTANPLSSEGVHTLPRP